MQASKARPLGTIQIDVDALWVYYDSIGQETPTDVSDAIYSQGIPRLLDLFDRFGIRSTFFVCGRDVPGHTAILQEMVRRGHEIANHSNGHQMGYARLSPAEKRADIAAAGELIATAVGQRPVGFKSPGFSFGADLLIVLGDLGYLYDSSLLPTPYAPLLRGLQRLLSGGRVDPSHYGRVAFGLAPLHPYLPDPCAPYRALQQTGKPVSGPSVWEAPVTTMPVFRLPIHSTFVLSSGRLLFDLGLALAGAFGVPINYLLHAADVIDPVEDPALVSYRFLNQPWAAKRPLYEHMLGKLTASYRLVPTRELLESCHA